MNTTETKLTSAQIRAAYPYTMTDVRKHHRALSRKTVNRFCPLPDWKSDTGRIHRFKEMPEIVAPFVVCGIPPAELRIAVWSADNTAPLFSGPEREKCEEALRRFIQRAFTYPNRKGWATELFAEIEKEMRQ